MPLKHLVLWFLLQIGRYLHFVVQVAPAVRVAIGEMFGLEPVIAMTSFSNFGSHLDFSAVSMVSGIAKTTCIGFVGISTAMFVVGIIIAIGIRIRQKVSTLTLKRRGSLWI